MNINDILKSYFEINEAIKELKKDKKLLKRHIHNLMTQNERNNLITPNFIAIRDVRTREHISKKNIPEDIWNEYSSIISFPYIIVVRNENI